MNHKYCKFCDIEHPLTEEYWYRCAGRLNTCKVRRKVTSARWFSENSTRKREIAKRWSINNTEREAVTRHTWREANRTKMQEWKRQYEKARYHSSVEYKLARILRTRIHSLLRRNPRQGSAGRDLGCSVSELRKYLESQFTPEMNWQNHGAVWHVDHILPLANYQLADRGTLRRLVHYTNLQPLLALDNFRKSNRED